MEGKIDKNGNLFIKRRGELLPQYCPFTASNKRLETIHVNIRDALHCGDHCPLFGSYDKETGTLDLCHRELKFDEFTQEEE